MMPLPVSQGQLRFVTNHYPESEMFMDMVGGTVDTRRWLADKVIGEPQATEAKSVQELKAVGIVGVYERVVPK